MRGKLEMNLVKVFHGKSFERNWTLEIHKTNKKGHSIGSDLHISQKDIFLHSFQKLTELFALFRFQATPVLFS
jgi:hypothetical protein